MNLADNVGGPFIANRTAQDQGTNPLLSSTSTASLGGDMILGICLSVSWISNRGNEKNPRTPER